MWLLSTDRAELHYFARNFDAVGGYAILSHTWDGNEQTLQQVRAIVERCRANGANPRDDADLSPKIRECCILAQRDGYRWVWIDSCCIDKTSSSELSEAINSMYQWYTEAEGCYANLADVPSDCVLKAPESAFRRSRWHTRGWTLPELIAPDSVIFLSVDWRELGNRATLVTLLEEITRIPSGVLTAKYRPAYYSVSGRMSWASMRKTTRVEDEAYCLMGLFGVSMPTNYGEGKQAFIRLQYEIMRRDSDMSLFAFGDYVNQDHTGLTLHPQMEMSHPWRCLLADSPRELNRGYGYIPDLGTNAKQQYPPPLDSTGPFDAVELPSATVTSYGIQFRLPIYEADDITIAVILCESGGRHCGLFLRRDDMGKDPRRPRYFTGCVYKRPSLTGSATYVARLVDLGDDLYNFTFNGRRVEATWRTIYVVPTTYNLDYGRRIAPNIMLDYNPTSRFRVPLWLVARFATLQFEIDEMVKNTEALRVVRFFHRLNGNNYIFVSLGSCTKHCDSDEHPLLWAKVDVAFLTHIDTFTHDCSVDHIDSESWVTRSKVFGDAERRVRLSLTPSTRMPDSTLVIHLELFGRFFEAILREAGVPSLFPSLADLERDALHRAPTLNDPVTSSQPRSPSQVDPIASRGPSSAVASDATSHTRPSRIPRLVSTRRLYTPARGRTQESHGGVCRLCGAPERPEEDAIQRSQTVSPSALPGSCQRFSPSGESGAKEKGQTEERN